MTSDPTLKRSGKDFLGEIRKELFKPEMIGWFVTVLLMPFWMTPVVYVLLKSLLFDPNGLIIWILLTGLSFFCLRSWFSFFREMNRFSKRLRPLLIASKNGNVEATKRRIEMRKERPSPHVFLRGLWGVHLMIPLIVVIVLNQSSDISSTHVKDHGKLRYSNRQENIRSIIKAIEARGIFRPLID
jgi:hypothetical protein